MNYVDISELDQRANYVRVTWNKMINYAGTFARELQELEREFSSGKYGPEWTFSRWLGVKCGMSLRTTYRRLEQVNRVASDEPRREVGLAVDRRAKAQQETDRRAGQLAWNAWLAEEDQRRRDVSAAYDEWLSGEKQRVKGEREAAQKTQAAERRHEAKKQRDRDRHRRIRAEKEQQIKGMSSSPISGSKNGNLLPDVATAIGGMVAVFGQIPEADRLAWLRRLLTELEPIFGKLAIVAWPSSHSMKTETSARYPRLVT
jgi:hypothetical protein